MNNRKTHLLMGHPEHFDIKYAINAHMMSDGQLNKADRLLAIKQWQDLKNIFEKLGTTVSVIHGPSHLPDFVFSANQTLPFTHPKTKKPSVLLSQMKNPERREEVSIYRKFFEDAKYEIYEVEGGPDAFIEGNGDILIHPNSLTAFAGHGHRTNLKTISQLSTRFGFEIVPLRLISEHFYHLDTCFSIINRNCVCYVEEAFDPSELKKALTHFETKIQISFNEGIRGFAGNCYSPDGQHIVVQKGNMQFCRDLKANGLTPIETDTSEYMKSGGSVFCMKMELCY